MEKEYIDYDVKIAKKYFNETWDLMDKAERSDDDIAEMLHKTHASCERWRSFNNPINNARGEWQVSRVYSVLKHGELALIFAKKCLKITLENDLKDFDLAFAYESVARAYAILKNIDKANEYIELALSACQHIKNDKEKDYTIKEVLNIKSLL